MMPSEIHSSDLTASCLRAVQLRHAGKIVGETPTAMLRGLFAGEALAAWHAGNPIDQCIRIATERVEAQALAENRPITTAARGAMLDIAADTTAVLEVYAAEWPADAEVLGCEVPVRLTVDVDGEPVEFASHLDLLYRHAGRVVVGDWKWREEAATMRYLSRHMQLGMYGWAVRHGEVQLDGEWFALNVWPDLYWIDLGAHKPYQRKGEWMDPDTGEAVAYVKGDSRPRHAKWRKAPIVEAGPPAIRDEFATRVRMMRANLWPTNPDPVGCQICPSGAWCPSFNGGSREQV